MFQIRHKDKRTGLSRIFHISRLASIILDIIGHWTSYSFIVLSSTLQKVVEESRQKIVRSSVKFHALEGGNLVLSRSFVATFPSTRENYFRIKPTKHERAQTEVEVGRRWSCRRMCVCVCVSRVRVSVNRVRNGNEPRRRTRETISTRETAVLNLSPRKIKCWISNTPKLFIH